MSNQTVGTVYQQIIRDVVDSSRVDFEEGGVDESVLDELSRVSASISAVPLFPIASHHHFLRIKYSRPAMRKPLSASPWVIVVVDLCCRGCCSALRALAAAQARNSESAGGPSGIWSLLCSQGGCGLAWTSALSGAQPHMTWNTTALPFAGNSYFAF